MFTGTIGKADYKIEVPVAWNGTLFLYSHGLVTPDQPNPAQDAGGPEEVIGPWLLRQGFAIAGSSYGSTLWAVADAFTDQMALLDYFSQHVGKPRRVVAWGHSLGGLISAGLIQLHSDRFAAAISFCGIVAGAVGYANTLLDGAYAFRTLLAPESDLQVAPILNSATNAQIALSVYNAARATPAGQARIAMAASMADLPGWFDPNGKQPEATDLGGWTSAIDQWFANSLIPAAFSLPFDFEHRAAGNPSWNMGVNYHEQFAISAGRNQVTALYQAAGLDVDRDLRALDAGQRVVPDAEAVAYLKQNITFDGQLRVPVLTMHTTADGTVIPEDETAYADVVKAAGNQDMLRQLFVNRAGHCAFTPAETIAAIETVLDRLDRGHWDNSALAPTAMNAHARAAGSSYQRYRSQFAGPPSFVDFSAGPYPRPFPFGARAPV